MTDTGFHREPFSNFDRVQIAQLARKKVMLPAMSEADLRQSAQALPAAVAYRLGQAIVADAMRRAQSETHAAPVDAARAAMGAGE